MENLPNYSKFVNSAYIISGLILLGLIAISLITFRCNSKKLADLKKDAKNKS